MKLLLSCAAAVLCGVIAVSAVQAEDSAVVLEQDMAQFIIGKRPPGFERKPRAAPRTIEKPAATDGTSYAVIAPTFNGSDGNTSFIRLFNLQANTTSPDVSYPITVIGTPTGSVYGTATIAVKAGASPQYSLSDILTAANAGALTGGDDGYSLYIAQTGSNVNFQGYQHVIYNGSNNFFEDVSVCNDYLGGRSNDTQQSLVNVHTSKLSTFPAQVILHNYAATSVTYKASVFAARTGLFIGQVSIALTGNTTYSVPETFFETQLNWTPLSTQEHANIFFFNNPSANVFNSVNMLATQFIFNAGLAAYINMTVSCRLNNGGQGNGT